MKSAGNRGVLQSSFQVPHIHVLLVAPLRAGYMAQPGTDQHEGGVAIRERAHHPSAAADFPVKPFYDIIGTDTQKTPPIEQRETSVRCLIIVSPGFKSSFAIMLSSLSCIIRISH